MTDTNKIAVNDVEMITGMKNPNDELFKAGDEIHYFNNGFAFTGFVDTVFNDGTLSVNNCWKDFKLSLRFEQCRLIRRADKKCECGAEIRNDYRWKELKLIIRVGCDPCGKWTAEEEWDFTDNFYGLRGDWNRGEAK